MTRLGHHVVALNRMQFGNLRRGAEHEQFKPENPRGDQMKSDLGRVVRVLFLLVGIGIAASLAWKSRNAEWVQKLLQVDGPATVNIKFDNGSVRDTAPAAATASTPTRVKDQGSQNNAPGVIKKCLRGKEITYTDQVCPADAKVAPVTGGNVTVVGAPKAKVERSNTAEPGPKALRDALDLSSNENIREKMMERAVNQ